MTNSSAPLNSGSQPNPSLEEVGHVVANHEIPVELSTRFLEHFSEQLYSSPQKAFEELISNGWDAGATFVDVRLSPDLKASDATLCVLDNGTSMDEEGLRLLWRIAFSPKESTPHQHGRPIIGKFGIGKLATYVLANKLTYICKAEDGVIRRVTMDYGKIDQQREASPDRLISELKLPLYTMSEEELETALNEIDCGAELLNLIRNNVPSPVADSTNDEWGTSESQLTRAASQTWTLVVLSGLKPIGSTMKIGLLRRMLSAALPFGSEMAICINGDLLTSSKSNATVKEEWNIGPKISELGIDAIEIEVDEPDADDGADDNVTSSDDSETQPESKKEKIQITSSDTPYEHIEIPGIGKITGKVKLFEERISGGKSEDRGASNGFHINVLGRVVNQNDPSFGEENLSHAAWARFRMTVRVDGLNPFLTTNREQFREQRELKIFRAFLRQAFNKIRSVHDSDQNAAMPDGGDKLVQSLGVLSLSPLRNVVTEVLGGQPSLAALFDQSNIPDAEEKRKSWRDNTSEHIKNALDEIKYERMDDDSFVKFRISDNTIVVNKDHPFVQEHSRSRAEKELVLTVAMVNLLADVYALDIGVQPAALESIRNYRDQLMRFRAMQRRESGSHIAYLLTQSQNDSSHSKLMELVVSDALRYLGFHVLDLAKPGEPEGIATAFTFPSKPPTADDPTSALYRFSFDAKSSKHDKAQTGNINLAGVVRHRDNFKADYALVIAPGFQKGAVEEICEKQKVTPIKASDLGKLLNYTVEYGAIPLIKLQEIFQFFKPDEVSHWVEELEDWLKNQRPLSIATFLKALDSFKGQVPDALPAEMIAYQCRQTLGAPAVVQADVLSIAQGLAVLIPDLVGIDGERVVIHASAERVAAAVETQLERWRSEQIVSNSGKGEQS